MNVKYLSNVLIYNEDKQQHSKSKTHSKSRNKKHKVTECLVA